MHRFLLLLLLRLAVLLLQQLLQLLHTLSVRLQERFEHRRHLLLQQRKICFCCCCCCCFAAVWQQHNWKRAKMTATQAKGQVYVHPKLVFIHKV